MKVILYFIYITISLSIMGLIFILSHENQWVNYIFNNFEYRINFVESILVYSAIFLALTIVSFFSLKLSKKFDAYPLERKRITSFEQANDIYLFSYLGYMIISICLPTLKSFLLFLLLTIFILARLQSYYFNPLLLIFGYKFYFINQDDKSKILLITKNNIKNMDDLFINKENNIDIYQLNCFTYIYFNK